MTESTFPLFDAIESEQRRLRGVSRSAGKHAEEIEAARDIARELLRTRDEISMDDVIRAMGKTISGNWAGSVFMHKDFEWTGRVVKSERVTSHRRLLRTWKRR